ncbi:hypothetical protein C2G38_2237191 [Gigaspora rosea]|uniref:Uncharacterized protein n=1 Tax=Gigaspora rosea TaxID=44941 RepID=A0A397TPK5_9GLOM|nr:hypothetical protein C2G38_2237191 [Gigaspora rosea]
MAEQFKVNLIIWHKKISSVDEYLKLHNISKNKDKNWIIVTKPTISLKNNQCTDKIKNYSIKTDKYITISTLDEYEIIEHLKEQFFDDYAKSKGISHSEKELFLCFMNHNIKNFDGKLINDYFKEWNKKYKKFFH